MRIRTRGLQPSPSGRRKENSSSWKEEEEKEVTNDNSKDLENEDYAWMTHGLRMDDTWVTVRLQSKSTKDQKTVKRWTSTTAAINSSKTI